MTPAQVKALTILAEHGPLTPREFARLMWPDSEGWQRVKKCGNYGATRGKGMWQAGGSYLGKLRKLGFVDWDYDLWRDMGRGAIFHLISAEGRRALDEHTKGAAPTQAGRGGPASGG